MAQNPFDIVREFEAAIAQYTGARHVVAVNSCTSALFLALKWEWEKIRRDTKRLGFPVPTVTIPKRTYVSVPMVIKQAGFLLAFQDVDWLGYYRLEPFEIWDSARFFAGQMFNEVFGGPDPHFACVSFHSTKTLGLKRHRNIGHSLGIKAGEPLWDIEQGGAILHNDPEADAWFRRARFDGRTEGVAPMDDTFDMFGWHMYMNPSSARLGLKLLAKLPLHNDPLPNDPYPDLSLAPIFRR